MQENQKDEVWTISQAATFLGINLDVCRRLVKAGKLPGRKVGGRYLILKSQLIEFLRGEDT